MLLPFILLAICKGAVTQSLKKRDKLVSACPPVCAPKLSLDIYHVVTLRA